MVLLDPANIRIANEVDPDDDLLVYYEGWIEEEKLAAAEAAVKPGVGGGEPGLNDVGGQGDHGRAFVAGLSMGGYVAFALLERCAEKVQAAALLDTVIEADPSYAPALAQRAIAELLLADQPSSYGSIPPREAATNAMRYIERAQELDPELVDAIANAEQASESQISAQRTRIDELKYRLKLIDTPAARELLAMADRVAELDIKSNTAMQADIASDVESEEWLTLVRDSLREVVTEQAPGFTASDNPYREDILRHELRLAFDDARFALLAKDPERFRATLSLSARLAERYFEVDESLIESIQALVQTEFEPDLPEIGEALKLFNEKTRS